MLLKEEKKKKRRGSTKEEDEEEEARRSVSSVSGIYDERIASVYDLLQNLTTQRLQVIDTRSEALFLGKVRRGAKTGPSSKNGGVDRAGHIPSSIMYLTRDCDRLITNIILRYLKIVGLI